MADTSVYEDETLTPLEMPSTPQPHHASLPGVIPPPAAPSTSMLQNDPTSPSQAMGTQSGDTIKYSSPPPPSSSMTPPPSSQPPIRRHNDSPVIRSDAPSYSTLSSPPPTHLNGVKREHSMGSVFLVPSPEHIADASSTELREMLLDTISENARLEANLGEARMSAAHHKLQHQLLGIESEEDKNRMVVEHDMTRKEVEVLRMAEQAREARQPGSPAVSNSSRYIADLKAYCEAMDSEVRLLNRRLQKAKNLLNDRDEALQSVLEENRNYIKRIRENREHLNRLKSPGGIYSAGTPRQSSSAFPSTPRQYVRGTPKQTPRSGNRHGHEDSQDSFAALLLADRVLNQENSSAPSTPTMAARPSHRAHLHHSRNVQSLSSLPTTPIRSRGPGEHGHLLPSVQFAPQSEPRYRSSSNTYPHHQQHHTQHIPDAERTRKNRDSTISISDAEEIAAYNRRAASEDEIHESQASQSASDMLRRDPRESFEVLPSPTRVGPSERSGLLQAKILGNVTKPGAEKRKRVEDVGDYQGKKSKLVGEGVGLGIGGWS